MKTIFFLGLSFIFFVPTLLIGQDSFDPNSDKMDNKANALALLEKGQYEKAIYAFCDLLEEFPEDYDLYGKRGIAFLWNGQPTLALADLNMAIDRRPQADYYFYRASLLPFDDIQGKIANYDQAILLDPSNARYFFDRATLKMRAFREYIYNKPKGERLHINSLENKLGFSLSICKDFEKAAALKKDYAPKAQHHCEAFQDLKYYHVKN